MAEQTALRERRKQLEIDGAYGMNFKIKAVKPGTVTVTVFGSDKGKVPKAGLPVLRVTRVAWLGLPDVGKGNSKPY